MNYEEFKDLEEIFDSKFVKGFRYKNGETFYIEPAFYTQLMFLKETYPNDFLKVLEEMKRKTLEKKLASFVYDFENPFYPIENCVYREIKDVTDRIKFFYEDKSRGSDYGD